MRCSTSSMTWLSGSGCRDNMAALEQRAQPLDDLARAAVRRHDVREDGLHLGHIRRFLEEQFLRGLGIAEDDAERLVQLMGQRAGQHAQRVHARQVRQVVAQFLGFPLCPFGFGDVSRDLNCTMMFPAASRMGSVEIDSHLPLPA